jgi:hypothetical protein
MATQFHDTPEELDALRTSVKDWLRESVDHLLTFKRIDGSFRRDSEDRDTKPSFTVTARSYTALAYASRHLSGSKNLKVCEPLSGLSDYVNILSENLIVDENDKLCDKSTSLSDNTPSELSKFELSHLVDFIYLKLYFGRFFHSSQGEPCIHDWFPVNGPKDSTTLSLFLHERISQIFTHYEVDKDGDDKAEPAKDETIRNGEIYFDNRRPESRHFLVTLHSLRALEILRSVNQGPGLNNKSLKSVVAAAEQFCVRQCHYCHRGLVYRQDPARLAFAGVIYCMYEEQADHDLVVSIVEALSSMQQESGNWPASHPIVRGHKGAWYIATHELALSLTWLYFQPTVPDAARPLLLDMMEKYFRGWVIPTFQTVTSKNIENGNVGESFSGWYDDSAMGHGKVVGWATAIVCHFLSNYTSVLNDHINRRVIESLQLEAPSERYLIDRTEHDRNQRWSKQCEDQKLPVWPDLPPFSWSATAPEKEFITRKIAWNWTDPTDQNKLSEKLAEHLLIPIQTSMQSRPGQKASGILDGPPGTRKTSLVKEIAKVLEWPYIPVPASVIFDRGFDMMEARATEVFRRLNYLTECVIFFDEFEEFFRDREGHDGPLKERITNPPRKNNNSPKMAPAPIHDRTIAAFTTSAMLPRLQDLHDQKRCVIFLATNNLAKIDGAIIRPGRFDYCETIEHPELSRFNGEDSYLDNPGWRMLDQINVEINERCMEAVDTDRLKKIVLPVCKALKDPCVVKSLKHLNTTQQENPNEPYPPKNCAIRFSVVEDAMRNVEKGLDSGVDLSARAKKSILDSLNHQAKSLDNAVGSKMPPSRLPDPSPDTEIGN